MSRLLRPLLSAIAARAFVQADLDAGRLVQVAESALTAGPDYFLVRKRSVFPVEAVDSVWDWCVTQRKRPV